MSRTTRRNEDEFDFNYYQSSDELPYGNKEHRDDKPGDKPPSWFKKIRRRLRRARAKQAVRLGKDLPTEKHNDQYAWT